MSDARDQGSATAVEREARLMEARIAPFLSKMTIVLTSFDEF